MAATRFVAAEQTIDEVYAELGIQVTPEDLELHERIGRIADRVSADMRGYLRLQLADNERAGTWEPDRVVLERMRGNPVPVQLRRPTCDGAARAAVSGQARTDPNDPS